MSELRIKHRGPNSSYPVSPGTVSPLFDFTESPRATAEAAGEMAHPGAAAHVQVWGRCCSWEQGWEKPKKIPGVLLGPSGTKIVFNRERRGWCWRESSSITAHGDKKKANGNLQV